MSKRQITKLRRLGAKRIDLIDETIERLALMIKKSERKLLNSVVTEVLDKLDIDANKVIRATAENMRVLSNLNNVFDTFAKDYGVQLAKEVYKGVNNVTSFNIKYFEAIQPDKEYLFKIDKRVVKFVDAWLGIDETKGAVKNGYLHKIIQSNEVRLEVQEFMSNSILGGKGWLETKNNFKAKMLGDNEQGTNGYLSKYYRNFVYDTFASVDRAAADVYREDLNLKFGVYEGGIIKTTRPFCKEHNGNVYHISEIEAFEPDKGIPTDGTYNPLVMLGGYNCRHYINWITEAYALTLRPDVITFISEDL